MSKNLSTSPDSYTRFIEIYKKKLENATSEKDIARCNEQIQFYEDWNKMKIEKEKEDSFKENNLEYDLRSTDWILQKARNSKSYAQSIYAALCNNEFIKNGKVWSCSWRYAGGIVANMRIEGDYLDYYCSGIGVFDDGPSTPEGEVTDEVREDFLKLGWSVKDE
jgi:hypothetical protein